MSILVAVRNEMDRMLVESLSSFIAQDYPAIEIVAVDDHSEDGSRRVLARLAAEHPRLQVIDAAARRRSASAPRSSPRPMRHADPGCCLPMPTSGSRPTPCDAAWTMRSDTRIDALSLLPRTLAVSLVEQTALAAVSWLVFEGGHLRRCNRDDAPVGLAAAGPFFLVSRDAFDGVGGYAAIPQNVLIDVALAVRLRERGFRYRYLRSDGGVETRMYQSLGEIWRGFGKNAYLALGNHAALAIGAVATATTLTWLPPILVIAGLARRDGMATALGAAAYAAMAAAQSRGGVFMGTTLQPAALTLAPLGALLWLAIVVQSVWRRRARATVVWKGRALPVFDPRADR